MKAQVVLGNKFGIPVSQLEDFAQHARALSLNLVGIHFHVGSPSYEVCGHAKGVAAARKAFEILARGGFSPYILDIGGGFPGIEYGFPEEATFEQVIL